ncbi:digestive cysteine proteinase 1-like [Bolinopsis microptera]|uniref:digestive cysteine proteinase 1-like n=1 Tax=Bolinopsis microptera TaxID=2820187 RepID=UPI003078EAE2
MFAYLALLVAIATVHGYDRTDVRITSALMSPHALQKLYSDYSQEQGRKLNRAEQRVRLGLFRKTLQTVAEHNSHDESWQMGLNQFSDMTEEEMYGYTGANFTQELGDDVPEYMVPLTAGPSSGSRDWRTANGGKHQAVTKIKSQGRCGSCWVFSAMGALEGAYKNKGSILKSFSEQEGLECSMKKGCGGGWMHYVYNYAKKSGRLAEMKHVPYKGKEGPCRFSSSQNGLIAFKVSGYTNAKGDSRQVAALESSGPLSVAYTCTKNFFKYRGGVYNERSCSGGGHAVTNVGYAPDYFIMKNSWGASFGEKGYFRIGRGNVCGITNQGLIPTLSATGKTDPGQDEGGDDGGDDNGGTCVAVDKNARCAEWAARDPSECTENWRYMTDNCRKSCKQCECVDVGLKCAEWKGKGYCDGGEFVNFMSRLCRKTCGKCDKDDGGDDDNDGGCQEGFKKCPDGSCVHEHWNCD